MNQPIETANEVIASIKNALTTFSTMLKLIEENQMPTRGVVQWVNVEIMMFTMEAQVIEMMKKKAYIKQPEAFITEIAAAIRRIIVNYESLLPELEVIKARLSAKDLT